ncbi:cuticle protein 2-like [Homalodisca vitripennis]|uniref:cuticle protein 2-like n=1 Tax=Homalodisca vitripennis TaxID=197043 RepID=UPI001EEC5DB3|nr:cuticle protein 2-like [Homalodisca vitripennis]
MKKDTAAFTEENTVKQILGITDPSLFLMYSMTGHIADTHEVAAAKGEHFAAVAKAESYSGYGLDYSGRYAGGYGEYSGAYSGAHYVAPYHGPHAKPVVLKSGYLADTNEVAAAKQHHLEALYKANHHDRYL